MEWENQSSLDELLAEAENLDAGYLSAARVLPDRREEQLASWRIGPLEELRSCLAEVANEVPAGTRLRIRLYRQGGKSVRGVVCRTPTPCPNCAGLLAAVEEQNHRIEDVSDDRDDAQVQVDELRSALADAQQDLKAARRDRKQLIQHLHTARRRASAWRERTEALSALVNTVELG